ARVAAANMRDGVERQRHDRDLLVVIDLVAAVVRVFRLRHVSSEPPGEREMKRAAPSGAAHLVWPALTGGRKKGWDRLLLVAPRLGLAGRSPRQLLRFLLGLEPGVQERVVTGPLGLDQVPLPLL